MDFRRLKYYRHNSLILVASGNSQLLEEIAQVLSEEKYHYITATNGEKAWELILQKKPAMVIADWALPDVSGLALCHRLKASLEHPDLVTTYFILIVESFNEQQHQIALETGIDEFLGNPLNKSEIKVRVRSGMRATALTQSLTWTNQRLLAQNDLLDALSLSDPLTKVLSEQAFDAVIPKIMQQFQGLGNYKGYSFLSILSIDIDRFSQVTQSYGQQIGNEAIKAIAGRLSHSCAANSLLYRCGLDEFVCVTPHAEAHAGKQLASSLLDSIRKHPIAVSSGLLFPLTVSIGVVVKSLDNHKNNEHSFSALVKLSAEALLQAQKSGGDRLHIEEL